MNRTVDTAEIRTAGVASPSTAEARDLIPKPKRADARRNYDKVVAAARDAFTEGGAETSLESIARQAGVGIGTLYRNFPNRQALLEAVYVGEVERLNESASDFSDREPFDALAGWLRRFLAYAVTKQALIAELFNYIDRDNPLFSACRGSFYAVGEPLLARAQAAGEVRTDITLPEILQLVGGIAKTPSAEPEVVERLLEVALDGLRYQPAAG